MNIPPGYVLQPDGSYSKPSRHAHHHSPLQNPIPERHEAPALTGCITQAAWTSSEDAILRSYYQSAEDGVNFTIDPLVDVLKRTKAAIHCRANAIGVSFERGKRPRNTPKPVLSQAKFSLEERSEIQSERMKQRHATVGHPMLGRDVPQEVRDKISAANKGRKVSEEEITKRLLTRAKNGTLAPNHNGRSWKSGWREIGGRRIFARSRWEANYARYLDFLKLHTQIKEWEHEPETFWFDKIKRGARSYLPDFRVTFMDGRIEYHEVKGWMDSRSKTKLKRMRIYHPSVVMRIIDREWFSANARNLAGVIRDWEHGKI